MRRKEEKKSIWGVVVGLATLITAAYFVLNSCEKETLEHADTVNGDVKINADSHFPFIHHCGELMSKGIFLENRERVGSAYFFNEDVKIEERKIKPR